MPESEPSVDLGFGIGVRPALLAELLQPGSGFDFLEIISEDFLGSERRRVLDELSARYPIVMHGLSMSIAGSDALDLGYLRALRELADSVGARWVSDHLCWTGAGGAQTHELLPVPLTEPSLKHVSSRVSAAQDVLGRSLVLENPSAYLAFDESTMPEPEFFGRLIEQTGCRLLLDVNNVYVSGSNLGFDPAGYIDALPAGAVAQIHLAGSRNMGSYLIDSHDERVSQPVWDLYAHACRRFGPVSTSLEWDTRLPEPEVLREELGKAAMLRSQSVLLAAILDGASQTGLPVQHEGEPRLRPLSRAEGISIYGAAYRARHVDSVRSAFPILGELIGSELDDLALGYLAARTGRSFGEWVSDAFSSHPWAGVVRDVVALETTLKDLRDRHGEQRILKLSEPSYLHSLAIRAGVALRWSGSASENVTISSIGDELHAAFLSANDAGA